MATKGKTTKARAKVKTLTTKKRTTAAVKGGNLYTGETVGGRRVQKFAR